MAGALFNIFVFPGLLFIAVFGLLAEYIDRKFCAKLQNRVGPPWFQPLADFIKLLAKEDIVPQHADRTIFTLMPLIAITAIITSFLYIPLWIFISGARVNLDTKCPSIEALFVPLWVCFGCLERLFLDERFQLAAPTV